MKEKKKEELKECTFQPNINSKTKRRKRTVDDLYNWQKEKIRKITQKEIQKAKNEKKIMAIQPRPSRKSRKILKKHLRENKENGKVCVEDRLLQQQRKKEEKIRKLRQAQLRGFFMPKISHNIPSPKYRKQRNSKFSSSREKNYEYEKCEHTPDVIEDIKACYKQINSEVEENMKKVKTKKKRKQQHRRIKSYNSKPKTRTRKSSQKQHKKDSSLKRKSSKRAVRKSNPNPPKQVVECSKDSTRNKVSKVESKLGMLCEEFKNLNNRYGRRGSLTKIQNTFEYFYENCPAEDTEKSSESQFEMKMKHVYEDDHKKEKSKKSRKKRLSNNIPNYSERKFEKAKKSIRSSRKNLNQKNPQKRSSGNNYYSQRYLDKNMHKRRHSLNRYTSEQSQSEKEIFQKDSDSCSKSSFKLAKRLKKCRSKSSHDEEFVVKFKPVRKNLLPRAPKKCNSVKKIVEFKRKNSKGRLKTPTKEVFLKGKVEESFSHSKSIEKFVQTVSGKKEFLEDKTVLKSNHRRSKNKLVREETKHQKKSKRKEKNVIVSTFDEFEFQEASQNLLAAIMENQLVTETTDRQNQQKKLKKNKNSKNRPENYNNTHKNPEYQGNNKFPLKNEILNLDGIIASKIGIESPIKKPKKRKHKMQRRADPSEFSNLNFNLIEGNYLAEPKTYSKMEPPRRKYSSRSSSKKSVKSRNTPKELKNQNSLRNLSNGYSSNYSRKYSSGKKGRKDQKKCVKRFKLVKKLGKNGDEVRVVRKDLEVEIDSAFRDLRRRFDDVSIYDDDFIISER